MKKNKFIVFLFIAMFFMLGCSKKRVPGNTVGEVQFYFEGNIGNDNKSYLAGENDYVMQTDFVDAGPNDVLRMLGTFAKSSTPNSDYLRFEFYGYDSVNNSFLMQNIFNSSDLYSFSEDIAYQTVGVNKVQFDAPNIFGSKHVWDFGDGAKDSAATVIHTYTLNSPVNVKLTSSYQFLNCTDSITNVIDLANMATCKAMFDYQPVTLDSIVFLASAGFINYNWKINGVDQFINSQDLAKNFSDTFRKEIQLTASSFGCTSVWKGAIRAGGNYCAAVFKYTILDKQSIVSTMRLPFKTCIITYEKAGEIYKSFKPDGSDQSNRVVFKLNSVDNYLQNEKGQETFQLSGSVNTFLYNVNNPNDSIPIQNSKLRIAIAHP